MPPDAQVGDRFAEVLEFCRHYLLAHANSELPDHLRAKGGASDLVQDALAAAHRSQNQFVGRTVAELRSWLRAILSNELATFRRRYARTAARDVAREAPITAAAACAVEFPPLVALVRADERRELAERLARLPEDARRAVLMRFEEGLGFAAIGARLGRTEEAARKLLSRALDTLRGTAAPRK